MGRIFRFRLFITAAALVLAAGASTLRTQAQTNPGYLVLQKFSANATSSGDQVMLSGQILNECTGGLPAGSLLRVFFDQGVLLNVKITAAFRQTQRFATTVSVPKVSPPRDHVTAYRFTIVLPGESQTAMSDPGPDMKTSPCLVTPILGDPSE